MLLLQEKALIPENTGSELDCGMGAYNGTYTHLSSSEAIRQSLLPTMFQRECWNWLWGQKENKSFKNLLQGVGIKFPHYRTQNEA